MPTGSKNLTKCFRKISHCIFDMDGLLLDTETLYTEAIQGIVSQYGKEFTWDLKMRLLGLQHIPMCKKVIEFYSLPIGWEEFSRQMREKTQETMKNPQLMPGAERLVRHLHTNNVPLALATSSGQEMVEIKSKNHGELFKLFNHKVCGSTDSEVKEGKPAPDIFLVAASRFSDKPNPDCCLVFEDAPNGVTAANSANMQVVMVPDEHVPREMCQHATIILNSLEEFKPELFGLPPFKA